MFVGKHCNGPRAPRESRRSGPEQYQCDISRIAEIFTDRTDVGTRDRRDGSRRVLLTALVAGARYQDVITVELVWDKALGDVAKCWSSKKLGHCWQWVSPAQAYGAIVFL